MNKRSVPAGLPTSSDTVQSVDAVFSEAVSLFHRMAATAEDIHRQGALSGGRRGILRGLKRAGPQTVPQMARIRPVSRQHIQTLVNDLADEGLVEFVENPAHKRSRLVSLTHKGEETIKAMLKREASLLARANIPVSNEELETTARTLHALRGMLSSDQWKRLTKTTT